MSPELKKYIKILKKIEEEDLDDHEIDKLEEKLDELYFDLSDEEVAYIETIAEENE